MEEAISQELKNIGNQYDTSLTALDCKSLLRELVEKLSEKGLEKRNIKRIHTQLNVLFADLSYLFYPFEKKEATKDRLEQEFKAWEGWFHTVIHLVLQFIGIQIRCEVTKHEGRIDAVVEVEEYLYIMEFKLEDGKSGLQQIKDRKYAHSYYNSNKQVILMSIAFDQKKRKVKEISSTC